MDLYSLGLLDTLRAYREGRTTVQDYVTSLSERVAVLEPRIQAWEWFDPSRAMAEAEERAGGILADLPLYGIPVGVKDNINTRGIPTRMGSRIFANHVPTASAWVVRRPSRSTIRPGCARGSMGCASCPAAGGRTRW